MDFRGYDTQPTYVDKMTRLRNALAEKDREIEAKETELGKLDADLIVLRGAYHALMKQAVRFAGYLQEAIDISDIGGLGMYEQVQHFLVSPEVQAWRELEVEK